MGVPSKQRRCSSCGQVFASPSAWLKHLPGGLCQPVERFSLMGMVPTGKGWEVKQIVEFRRGK